MTLRLFFKTKFILLPSLFAIFFLGPTIVRAENSIRWECFGLIVPHLGSSVEDDSFSPFSPAEHEEYAIYKLGEGQSGVASVYRLISRHEARVSKVIKIYNAPGFLSNDLLAFDLIEQVNSDTGVEIVSRSMLNKLQLEISDIRGRTLRDVLNDPTIDKRAKAVLLDRYQNFIKVVQTGLIKNFPESQTNSHQASYHFGNFHIRIANHPVAGKSTTVFIKSDNILVESKTARLFLIDPF